MRPCGRGPSPSAEASPPRPWAPGQPRGIRALTADQPPAQLPDALLTGFFPLKFTPKVRQHAGGALAPRDTPTATPTWARDSTYRDAGFPGDARHARHALEAHGPRGAGHALRAAGAVGALDAFRAQLPSAASLGAHAGQRGSEGSGPRSCRPTLLPLGRQGGEGSCCGPGRWPSAGPRSQRALQSLSWEPCQPLTSPLGPTGPPGPCKDKMRISATRVARAWAAAAADEAKARRPPSRAAPILRGAVWVTARTAHCAQAEEPLSPSKPDGAPRSEAPQPARPGRSGGFPGSRVKIVSGFATVHTCPRTRTPTGSRLGGFRVPQMRRKPEMQS